jgi:hypothetical protein
MRRVYGLARAEGKPGLAGPPRDLADLACSPPSYVRNYMATYGLDWAKCARSHARRLEGNQLLEQMLLGL